MEGALTAMMAPAAGARGFSVTGTTTLRRRCGIDAGRRDNWPIDDWVSCRPILRKATVEIDRVPVAELPLDNGAGASLAEQFSTSSAGISRWSSATAMSRSRAANPGIEPKAHAAMRAKARARPTSTPNGATTFWLCGGLISTLQGPDQTQFEELNGERGFMYDDGAATLPREGFMVASYWLASRTRTRGGPVRGMRAGETVTYFRTAVHELGHAMGLDHNCRRTTALMNIRRTIIAENSLQTPATPFPDNMLVVVSLADDEHRLRHWPDLIVRPGGSGAEVFSGETVARSTPFKSDQPQVGRRRRSCAAVPLGAPVRINLSLTNVTGEAVRPPGRPA